MSFFKKDPVDIQKFPSITVSMFSGCNVSEQKVWSGKDGQMQARSVSGHYGETFYTEYNSIINYISVHAMR